MTRNALIWVTLTSLAILCSIWASLLFGARMLDPGTVISVLLRQETDGIDSVILQSARVPRTLIAICVGAGLGLAGSILQTVTHNLLADPGLLGINSGAAFAIVLALTFASAPPSLATLGAVAALGAALTGIAVFVLAGGASAFGNRPLRLILSGAVMAIALGSLTHMVLLLRPGVFEASQAWLAGSFADRPSGMLRLYVPVLAIFILGGLLIARPMQVLLVSETQGLALGAQVARLRFLALAVAAGVCGTAVSLAGPIVFVGLIAPHVARWLTGPRPQSLFLASAAFGAILVLLADVAARLIVVPEELPVGLMIAIVGVPFYLLLLRSVRLK